MAHIKQLPSGKWFAEIRITGTSKRLSKSFPTKGMAESWAAAKRAELDRGELYDHRSAKILVGAWHDTWRPSLVLEASTLKTYDARLRLHVLPYWKDWQLGAITPVDVQTWVRQMIDAGVGIRAIQQAHTVFASMLQAAVKNGRLVRNPARGIDLPRSPIRPERFFSHSEVNALLNEMDGSDQVMVDLGCHVGLRFGEMTGLRIDHVHPLRRIIEVVWIRDVDGQLREYPKTRRSRRPVPVPPNLIEPLSELMVGKAPGDMVFTAPGGGHVDYYNFYNRVWTPALERAGIAHCPPKVMRHTAASHLVQDGVDLYRVQRLLGHESYQTTLRYSHLAPGYHDAITEAWNRRPERPAAESVPNERVRKLHRSQ